MIIFMARELLNTTGKRIRVLRDEAGITQRDLGDAIGIRQAYMSQIEKDKSMPPADLLAQIARVLRTSTDYLLLLTDDADRASSPVSSTGISEEAEEAARIIDSLVSHAQRRYCVEMIKLFVGYRGDSEKEWAGELELIADQVSPEMAHSIAQRLVEGKPILEPADLLNAATEHQRAKAPAQNN